MSQRPPKLLIAVFTAIILIVVMTMQVLYTIDARRRAIDAAEQRTRNLAYVAAAYVNDNFALADTALRQLVVHARRVGGAHAPSEEWDPILAAAKAGLAGSGSISVVDAGGIVTHSTQRAIVGQSRRHDFVFEALAGADTDDPVVDMPFLTPTSPPRYVLPLGRRLTDANGKFAGAVVVSVIPGTFREFFRTIDVGSEGAIWVFHPNGVVLFRVPSGGNPINAPAATNPIYQAAMASGGSGTLNGPVDAGGPSYVTSYARTGAPPLIVAVSYSTPEALAYWHHQVRSAIFATGVLAITLTAMMIVLFRQIDARSKAEADLVEVQRLESQRLRESNERLAAALEGEQRARRESEQASYLKDQFLMTVSHELRTPLTAIYGWARVLSAGALPEDQRERAIEAVERNARVQTKLIDDLLDVSRAISGKLRIEARPISVAEVLNAAADTLAPAVLAKGIVFRTNLADDLGIAFADPDRLQQIAWNLLSNAIKFTPEGGRVDLEARRTGDRIDRNQMEIGHIESGQIESSQIESSQIESCQIESGQIESGQIEIIVRDSGVGIAPEFLPHVFERFRQGDAGTRRQFGGLGLGLAIVRHLVELHGGTVTASSDGPDRGAVFRILLPTRLALAGTAQLASVSPTVGQ